VLPALLTLLGGGWWQGSIDDLICDALARQRCSEGHLVVVAVEYRLAPEHPYPTGVNDAFAAFRWLVENAKQLGVDAENISIGGGSAGGNLAAGLAMKLRDTGGAQPRLQLLEVPALDLTLTTSRNAAETGGQDMEDELAVAVDRYIADSRHRREPLASPLLADNLAGLPPAVIFTAEHDVLHADGEQYATRLNAAGVPARVIPHPGALHGSAMLTRSWQPAAAWQSEAAAVLRSVHWDKAEIKAAV
jgi:acetyl esterase